MRNVRAVVASEATDWQDARGVLRFANVRAAMYWNLRDLLTEGPEDRRLCLPPDPELLADLTAPRWHIRGGRVYVEPKDDGTPNCIRARLGRSTDCGDAVALACWVPPAKAQFVFSAGKR